MTEPRDRPPAGETDEEREARWLAERRFWFAVHVQREVRGPAGWKATAPSGVSWVKRGRQMYGDDAFREALREADAYLRNLQQRAVGFFSDLRQHVEGAEPPPPQSDEALPADEDASQAAALDDEKTPPHEDIGYSRRAR